MSSSRFDILTLLDRIGSNVRNMMKTSCFKQKVIDYSCYEPVKKTTTLPATTSGSITSSSATSCSTTNSTTFSISTATAASTTPTNSPAITCWAAFGAGMLTLFYKLYSGITEGINSKMKAEQEKNAKEDEERKKLLAEEKVTICGWPYQESIYK